MCILSAILSSKARLFKSPLIFLLFAELLGDFLKSKPKETDGMDSVIVVDNVPQVGPEKLEKLQNMIRKIFSKVGKIQTEHFPMENGMTKG